MNGNYGIYDRLLLLNSSARISEVVIDPGRAWPELFFIALAHRTERIFGVLILFYWKPLFTTKTPCVFCHFWLL